MHLKTRMFLGFGIVLLLLVIGGIVGTISLFQANSRFATYERVSDHALTVGNTQYSMTQMRRLAARYLKSNLEVDADETMTAYQETDEHLVDVIESTKDPERLAILNELKTVVNNYGEGFTQQVALMDQRNTEVENCNRLGPEMENSLTAIMDTAARDGDNRAVYNCGTALSALLLGRIYLVKFLDTNSESDYQRALSELDILNDELQQLDAELQNKQRRELLATVISNRSDYINSMGLISTAINERNTIQAEKLDAIATLDGKFAEMKDSYDADLAVLAKETATANGRAILLLGIIVVLAIAIGIVAALFIIRSITVPIQSLADAAEVMSRGNYTAEMEPARITDEIGTMTNAFITMQSNTRQLIQQVAQASADVASAAEELSAGADETSKAVQEVAKSIGDMAAGSQNAAKAVEEALNNLSQNAKAIEGVSIDIEDVATYATQASSQGEEGKRSADEGTLIINKAADSVKSTTGVVTLLGEKTTQIAQFIGIITGIADQTNLLALNAAIEAARAGEAGRGFAVVAEEVRKLAEESNSAAGNITELVTSIEGEMKIALEAMERSDTEVANGAETVGQASEMLGEIVLGIKALNDKVQNISAAAEEINASTGEVVSAMNDVSVAAEQSSASAQEVSSITQQQTASMEEIGANANTMAQLAQNLQSLVAQFQV